MMGTKKHDGHVVQHVKGGRLSMTQLIIRRGLTMFAAVALLAVGASVHFLVPLPEILLSETNFTLDWINMTYTADQIPELHCPGPKGRVRLTLRVQHNHNASV